MLLAGGQPQAAAAACGGTALTASPEGDAWVGTFVRIYGPESDEDPQALWHPVRIVTGDEDTRGGDLVYLNDSCAPPTFRKGARYLVTTGHWPPSVNDTVAWRILSDGRVRLVTWLPASAYPAKYQVSTLRQALAVVRAGSLPPTDMAPAGPVDPSSVLVTLVREAIRVLTAVVASLQRAP
jgi:hypothetical protein